MRSTNTISMKPKILMLVLVLAVFVVAAGVWYWSGGPVGNGVLGELTSSLFRRSSPSASPRATQKTIPVSKPPSGEPAVYKGFWMPCGFFGGNCQTMTDVKRLKSVSANIAFLAPTIKINSRGEIQTDAPLDYMGERLAEYAKKYYAAGIRLGIAIELYYEQEFKGRGSGEPGSIPAEVAQQAGFLDAYNGAVAKIAQQAQKYGVEIFSPMNEPDLKLGEAVASRWGQEILPTVKKYYKGKILWKAAGGALDKYDTNFKGYDIIGFDPTPGGGPFEQAMTQYRTSLANLLDIAQARAARDSVKYVMITEFGTWGGAIQFTEEQKVIAHRVVFELGQGKVKGFIALDPPSDLDRGLWGTATSDEIRSWFAKL